MGSRKLEEVWGLTASCNPLVWGLRNGQKKAYWWNLVAVVEREWLAVKCASSAQYKIVSEYVAAVRADPDAIVSKKCC